MKFSAFSRFGHLRFKGGKPLAQRIYESMRDGMTDAFDMTKGTYQEAKTYAMAMGLACARLTLERANNQHDPLKAKEKLPSLERDFGLSPAGNATILDRQRAVSVRKRLLLGSKEGAIVGSLQTLLGSNFVRYRITSDSERVNWPSSPGTVGTWPRQGATLKWFRLLDPVATLSVPITVRYEIVNGLTTHPGSLRTSLDPEVGEKLTFEPEIPGIAESVAISTIVRPTGISSTDPTKNAAETDPWSLTATFAKPHTAGCYVHNAVALQTSTQREVLVVVKHAAAVDRETRRKINDLMARAVREVTRWEIAEETAAGKTGPWTVGSGIVGVTTVGPQATI